MTNRAFHNDASLAATVRTQVADHTVADEIIQGKYWENGEWKIINKSFYAEIKEQPKK